MEQKRYGREREPYGQEREPYGQERERKGQEQERYGNERITVAFCLFLGFLTLNQVNVKSKNDKSKKH